MSNPKAKAAARISPEHPLLAWLVVLLTLGLSAAAFSASFVSLSAVAASSGLAAPGLPGWLPWTLPIALDAAILTYTAGAVLKKSRGESARFAYWCLGAFTAVSTILNVAHVVEAQGFQASSIIPSVALGLMPLALMLSVHMLISVVVAPPEARDETGPVEEAVVAPVVQDAPSPVETPADVPAPVPAHTIVEPRPVAVIPAPAPAAVVPPSPAPAALPAVLPAFSLAAPEPAVAPAPKPAPAVVPAPARSVAPARKPSQPAASKPAATRAFTDGDLPTILALSADGLSRQKIADQIGISKSAVQRALAAHESKAAA